MGERRVLCLIVFLSFLFVFVKPQYCSESYISYTIPIETNWQYLPNTGSTPEFGDDFSQNFDLPFDFLFYGKSYSQITVSSNGFITFCCGSSVSYGQQLPSIDTGESIWLWFMDFEPDAGGTIQATTVVDTDKSTIFVVQFENVPVNSYSQTLAKSGVQSDTDPPIMCSSTITGQIRLYEDFSIEIEIRRAPIIYNTWVFSGIHSGISSNKTIYLLPPTQFSFGGFPWDNYPLGSDIDNSIQPNIGYTRTQCPTPIAARFICIECTSDDNCTFPAPKSGSPVCTLSNPTCVLNSTLKVSFCVHPNENSKSIPAISAYAPSLMDWTDDIICPSSGLSCCPFGPMTYYPPQDLIDLCGLSDVIDICYDHINALFCSACTTTPTQPFWKSITDGPYFYVTNDQKDDIDNTWCGTVANPHNTSDCSASIFDWPGFPFIVTPGCSENPVLLTSRTGIIVDGSGPTYYENELDCYWHIYFDPNYISQINFQFLFLDLETGYDYIHLEDAFYNSDDDITGHHDSNDDFILEYPFLGNEVFINFATDKSVVGLGFTIYYEGIVSLSEDQNWIITSYVGIPLAALFEVDGSLLIISTDLPYTLWVFSQSDDDDDVDDDDDNNTYNNTYNIYDYNTGNFLAVDMDTNEVIETSDILGYIDWILNPHPNLTNAFTIQNLDNNMLLFYDNTSNSEFRLVTLTSDNSSQGVWWTISVLPPISTCSSNIVKSKIPCSYLGIQYLSNFTGVFDDGGDDGEGPPGNYLDDSDCVWIINIPQAIEIQIQFCSLDTEEDYDYLYIFDGSMNDTSTNMFQYTGDYNPLPSEWNSTSNVVTVVFTSDSSNTDFGFIISYSCLLESGPYCPACTHQCIVQSDSRPPICACPEGYKLASNGKNCTDINECAEGLCVNASSCINYVGGYQCQCNKGWLLDSLNGCRQEDECALGTHDCDQICIKISDASMTAGNNSVQYTCACSAGYLLGSNGSCIALYQDSPTASVTYTPLFNMELPCVYNNSFAKNPGVNFMGCDAIVDNTTIKKCQLPFLTRIPHDTAPHYKCFSSNTELPWCATEVNIDDEAIETGTCVCGSQSTNVAKGGTAFITSLYGSEIDTILIDGIPDPSNAYLFESGTYWWIILTPPSVLTQITIYGCPSCYQNQTEIQDKFTLSFKFYKDFFVTKPVVLSVPYDGTKLNSTTIIVPVEATLTPTLVLAIMGRPYDTYFLTEIEPYANVPLSPPSIIDCALQLNRYMLNLKENSSALPLTFMNDMVVNIDLGLQSSFSFSITPGSTDLFSYVFKGTTGNQMEIVLNVVDNTVSILQNNIVKSTVNLDTPPVGNPISLYDGAIHYATILYTPLNNNRGLLSFSLDSTHTLLQTNVSLPSASNFSVGFEVSSSNNQKRSISDTGSYVIYSWKAATVQFKSAPSVIPPPFPLNTVLGVIFGVIVVFIVIAAIIFTLRNRGGDNLISVDNLPSEMTRHYRQYNKNPGQWKIQTSGAVSFYLKDLKMGSKNYTHMLAIWEELGGNVYNIEKASAVHSPSLLGVFTTKFSNLTAQVQSFKKGFVSESWKNQLDVKGLRQWTNDEYQRLVQRFPWYNPDMAAVVCALHGTSEESAHAISRTGFAALGLEDPGFYGKGMYFTTRAKYTFQYIFSKPNPTLLICFVVTGNAYPVIEHPYEEKSMMKQALMKGYQSHYVLTRVDGFPCPEIMRDPNLYYDEIVIEQEASILPFYMVTVTKDNFLKLGEESRKAQEEIKRAEGTNEMKQSRTMEDNNRKEIGNSKHNRTIPGEEENHRKGMDSSRKGMENSKRGRVIPGEEEKNKKGIGNSKSNRLIHVDAPEEVIKISEVEEESKSEESKSEEESKKSSSSSD